MIRKSILVKGNVQGVGFRPFVYKLALKLKLEGFVENNNIGVVIQIQGEQSAVHKFENTLSNNLPPLAKITTLKSKEIELFHTGRFEIIKENDVKNLANKSVAVSPDISICDDCKLDIKNKSKFENYFGTNCTNCGPRYSIIETVPYDRINTSMKDFILCKFCQKDYENPLNRRYHAQAISCNNCGPKITLSIDNTIIKTNNIYKSVSKLIASGKIGAVKGIGGFHIICDANNSTVIEKLRKYKNRPTKPFAIMFKNINNIRSVANINKLEENLLLSKEAPIVILNKKVNNKMGEIIAPNINKIGCFLPYSAFYHLLFNYLPNPIIATSANINSQSIIKDKNEIIKKLPYMNFIVDYDREIINSCDDSIVQLINDEINILRLSRGYAPTGITLPFKIHKKILAVGANNKSTICLAFDDKLIISPYIGDLDDIETFEYFKRTIDTFSKFYDFKADVIICDKHASYASTKWAKTQNIELHSIQHHLAHIYSVKAEHNLKGSYLGFAFDGTGYGDDKTLWGGEVFDGDERKYSFKQIKLLGANKAIKEPKRVALSLLFDNYNLKEVLSLDLPTIKAFSSNEIKVLYKAYVKNINSPLTSSVGRLFDAIASVSGTLQINEFEGQSGLLCEAQYDSKCKETFPYSLSNNIIDIKFDFFDKQIISKFINTLANIVVNITLKEKKDVILSGGVFQNKVLLELLILKFKKNNIKYFYNQRTCANDSGISLGQIWYYLNK